jgi:hypothetical protein
MGLAFDEQHATAGMLYSSKSALYRVWFVVAFLMTDGSPFTVQKYLVSVALLFLISLHTQIRILLYGDWACVQEQYQNTLEHNSSLLILLQNMLTLANVTGESMRDWGS